MTLLSVLFGLTVIVVTFPLFMYILKNLSETNYSEDLSYRQFFLFVRQENLDAERMFERNNTLYFQLNEDEVSMIEQYQDVIRRRVNYLGHEIYLRDVQAFETETLDYGIKITVTSSEGGIYEKTIPFER